jgi:hypothetical protein
MHDPFNNFDALWNAATSEPTKKIVEEMRAAEQRPIPLKDRAYAPEREPRRQSWEDRAADEAGVRRFGEL